MYKIITDPIYKINSATLQVNIIKEDNSVLNVDNEKISINGNEVYEYHLTNFVEDDIVEFKLVNIESDGVVIDDLEASYMFRY